MSAILKSGLKIYRVSARNGCEEREYTVYVGVLEKKKKDILYNWVCGRKRKKIYCVSSGFA